MSIKVVKNSPYGGNIPDFAPGRRFMLYDEPDCFDEPDWPSLARARNSIGYKLEAISGVKAKEYYCNFHLKRKDRRPRGCRGVMRSLIGYKP